MPNKEVAVNHISVPWLSKSFFLKPSQSVRSPSRWKHQWQRSRVQMTHDVATQGSGGLLLYPCALWGWASPRELGCSDTPHCCFGII